MSDLPENENLAPSTKSGTKSLAVGICVLLAGLVWLVFGQTRGFEFINYDDPQNVYKNTEVAKGLSLNGVAYAFTETQVGHWIPVTTLSHMLVSHNCGVAPSGHHVANVLLHGTGAILLFLVLWKMTFALWRSAFVAGVFAIHPLRVESVAWVTERKDVLSAVFFMLTLATYLAYVRQPQSTMRYLAVVVLFTFGLMSKSMLLTLPFVLLLLDYWPLGRFREALDRKCFLSTFRALTREKVPLLALSLLFAVIQIVSAHTGILSTEKIPMSARMANAAVSYVDYVGTTFWPTSLNIFYPHPVNSLAGWKVTISLVALIAALAASLAAAKRHPYLIVGWGWFLGMLVPVIGLIQSGELARADRYTYLPQIGLSIALTWLVADLATVLPARRLILGCLSAAIIGALTVAAHRQVSFWSDSESLWRRALACDEKNALAHSNLAAVLVEKGRRSEAITQYGEALEIDPSMLLAHNNLGLELLNSGRVPEAIAHFIRAIEINEHYESAHNNLGTAFLQTGQVEDAIKAFKRVLELNPLAAGAEANLGNAYFRSGRVATAIFHYQRALEITPDYAKARGNLANALLETGRASEAIEEFERTLVLQPDYPLIRNNLAWVLSTHSDSALRDGARAIVLAQGASRAAGDANPEFLRTLAAAYAETGRFAEAVKTAGTALELAKVQSNTALQAILQREVDIYRSGSPLRMAHEGK
jgi:tetratricopeptide (TPR) repeat protein